LADGATQRASRLEKALGKGGLGGTERKEIEDSRTHIYINN